MGKISSDTQMLVFNWGISNGVLYIKQNGHIFEVTDDVDEVFKLYEYLRSISTRSDVHALVFHSYTNDSTFSDSWRSMALALPITNANKRASRFFNAINSIMVCMSSMRIPTVHVASGLNSLLSLNMSLAFDYRIATEQTTFENANVPLGVVTKGSGYFLPKMIGEMKAIEVLGWRQFSAEDALSLGLIDKIVKQDAVDDEIAFLTTQEFNENRSYILSLRKLYKCNKDDLEKSLALEDELILSRLISPSFERLFAHHCQATLGVTPEEIRKAHHAPG